jgi:hypothetical protein
MTPHQLRRKSLGLSIEGPHSSNRRRDLREQTVNALPWIISAGVLLSVICFTAALFLL